MQNLFLKISENLKAKKIAGATLIELLVSIVVAGLVLSAVLASYASIVRAHQKNTIFRQMQLQSSFALTRIADKVRADSINYSEFVVDSADLTSSQEKLFAGDSVFQLVDENILMNNQPLFSETINVENLLFQITPAIDPFENLAEISAQLQPKVTIMLQIRSRIDPDLNLNVQTTISSRKYQ